jgi:catechol 2,3-dioxygenase-like lactoylglutathione lyase family enzyme
VTHVPDHLGLDGRRSPSIELDRGCRPLRRYPVGDYKQALAWYERLLGSEPSFLPNAMETVWELADHRFVFIEVRPEHAGHAMHTIFVDDLDARVEEIADRGIESAERETYSNGVRKVTYRDPDGNEIGFGGGPAVET